MTDIIKDTGTRPLSEIAPFDDVRQDIADARTAICHGLDPEKVLARTQAERNLMFSDLHGDVKSKAFRKLRARKAALLMHAAGKTNTKAATTAHVASFSDAEAFTEHMRSLATKSAAVRLARKHASREYQAFIARVAVAALARNNEPDVSVASPDA